MGCVSTISVFGLLGSTFPNSLRAMPGLKSLVSFESMTNCSTFPSGTPATFLRSGAGTYFGPMTKLSFASSGGFSPSFSTLNGGAPGASYLRTGGAADRVGHASAAIKTATCGLNMKPSSFLPLVSPSDGTGMHPIYPNPHRSALRRGGSRHPRHPTRRSPGLHRRDRPVGVELRPRRMPLGGAPGRDADDHLWHLEGWEKLTTSSPVRPLTEAALTRGSKHGDCTGNCLPSPVDAGDGRRAVDRPDRSAAGGTPVRRPRRRGL